MGNYGPRDSLFNFLTLPRHFLWVLLTGYGDSSGLPTEEGLVEDAVSVFKWLKSHTGSVPLYLWGHSLGSAYVSVSCNCLILLIRACSDDDHLIELV